MNKRRSQRLDHAALLLQSSYFIVSGLWPIFHLQSFLKVTGPKEDIWLVKTFGGMVAALGAVMLLSGIKRRGETEVGLAAGAVGATLAVADVYYVAKGRIAPSYLLDAMAELPFAFYWLVLRLPRLLDNDD
jgi:hypothetical protein